MLNTHCAELLGNSGERFINDLVLLRRQTVDSPIEKLFHWAHSSKVKGEKCFLRQELRGTWKEYTYSEVYNKAFEMAAALTAAGLRGQNVALLSKNCAEWMIADFAILMAGAISVPLLPGYSRENLKAVLARANIKAIFCGKLDNWAQVKDVVPDHIPRITFSDFSCESCLAWKDFIAAHPLPNYLPPQRKPEELATITFTSGSTGEPKGVMHSLGALGFVGAGIQSVIQLSDQDHLISYLPMAHVAERALSEFGVLYGGGTLSFIEGPETFVQSCQTIQPQVFLAVPRIWQKLQEAILKKLPQQKLDKLLAIPILRGFIVRKMKKNLGMAGARRIASGAAPLPPALFAWFNKLGILIRDGYGLTETFAYAHFALQEEVRAGSVGQGLPGVQSRISESGELQIKSPSNMLGFYNDETLTQEAFTADAFLKTGDMGRIDEDGFLFIVGRLKENFKTTKGKYVVPSQLETKLSRFQLIDQCCVMGAEMEAPYAIICLSEDAQKIERAVVQSTFEKFLIEVNQELENHEKISKLLLTSQSWTVDSNFLTPTLKIKRSIVESFYKDHVVDAAKSAGKVIFLS